MYSQAQQRASRSNILTAHSGNRPKKHHHASNTEPDGTIAISHNADSDFRDYFQIPADYARRLKHDTEQ
jgi:hypothetical protein